MSMFSVLFAQDAVTPASTALTELPVRPPLAEGMARIIVYPDIPIALIGPLTKKPIQVQVNGSEFFEFNRMKEYLILDVIPGQQSVICQWDQIFSRYEDIAGISFFLDEGQTVSLVFETYPMPLELLFHLNDPIAPKYHKHTPLFQTIRESA